MLIMISKFGQLGNRLFAFSHIMANAIEHNYTFINPAFDEYCGYFRSTMRNDFGRYGIFVDFRPKISFRVFGRFARLLSRIMPKSPWHKFVVAERDGKRFDLNDADFQKDVRRKIVFISGWPFYDRDNFARHADTIRELFVPVEEITAEVDRLISNHRKKYDVLFGVHIRKSDYAAYNDGKWFFDDSVYEDKMLQAQSHFRSLGKRVGFVVCSDEKVERENFANTEIIPGPGQEMKDLYALSQCDYIIGPPSTYSDWASFYGNVPRLYLHNASQPIKMEDATTRIYNLG